MDLVALRRLSVRPFPRAGGAIKPCWQPKSVWNGLTGKCTEIRQRTGFAMRLRIRCDDYAPTESIFTKCIGRTRLFESMIPQRPCWNFSAKARFSLSELATFLLSKWMLGDVWHHCMGRNRLTTFLNARLNANFCHMLCNTSFLS